MAVTHFISGLPRSGSTLLAAILRQNPRFHAGISSPVASLFMALQGTMSRDETSVLIDEGQKHALLKGLFDSYYHVVFDKVVFDTNRAWCSKMPALVRLFPAAKIICCVRHVSWIMDSLERLVRESPFDLSAIFGYDPGGTVYTRVNRLAVNDGLVGFAMDALREAFWGGNNGRLILVDYEALVKRPASTMRRLYEFIEEPPFAHDFENVEYQADEFDRAIGMPNLHRVRRKVEWIPRATVLPPDLFDRFAGDAFWITPLRGIPVIL
jgi:sulfotransferase